MNERSGLPTSDVRSDEKPQRLRMTMWCVLISLATLQTWVMGSYVNPDGTSYLDVADAYRRGDWSRAINGYWSPMYSWVLAGWLGVLRPSPWLETRALHFLGLLIFIGSLAAFEFFLTHLLACRQAWSAGARPLVAAVPDESLRLLGYGLLLWSWFFWFGTIVTPDLLMSVFVYLAAGLLLRIRAREVRWPTFVLLGACLALGYLAKTAMFPLSLAWLGIAWLADRGRRGAVLRISVGCASFLVVAAPWITALSLSKHRVTFGDAGRINYAAYVDGWDHFPDEKLPVHPTRRLLDHPTLYAFNGELPGSYPVHYDPSYWNEGVKPRFELRGQLRALFRGAKDVWGIALIGESFVLVGVFVLGILFFEGGRGVKPGLASQGVILGAAVLGIGMYCLVHVEARLIGVFTVVAWLGLYATFYRSNPRGSDAIGRCVPLAVLLAMGVILAPQFLSEVRTALSSIGRPVSAVGNREWRIARTLKALGVGPGDSVAQIGNGNEVYWARLARVQIVAEVPSDSERKNFEAVPESELLLERDGSMTSKAISAFVATGARAIVARNVPRSVAEHGWTRLGESDLYAYVLPPNASRTRRG